MSDFSQRLKEFMTSKSLSIKELSENIGVQRSGVSHILNGRNKPSMAFIVGLTERYPEISTQWLLHGKGAMITNVSGRQITDGDTSVTHKRQALESDTNVTPPIELVGEVLKKATQPSTQKQPEKQLKQVILIYSDGSFESFDPR